MSKETKIDLEMLLKVKRSGRRVYLTIPGDVAGNYRLEPGDLLRVVLKTLTRSEEDE